MALRGSTTHTCTPKPMNEPGVIISVCSCMCPGWVELTCELDRADSYQGDCSEEGEIVVDAQRGGPVSRIPPQTDARDSKDYRHDSKDLEERRL